MEKKKKKRTKISRTSVQMKSKKITSFEKSIQCMPGNYTVSMARSNMFYPALRLSKKIKQSIKTKIENEWYYITFDQLMDQTDSNIIMSILLLAKERTLWQDGSLTCFFNIRDIQECLGIKAKSNHQWLKNKLLELRKINVEIRPKNGSGWGITGMIRKFNYIRSEVLSNKCEKVRRKYTIFNDNRHKFKHNTLFYVTFESEFVKMIYEDINIYCKKLVPELLKIKSGPIQAMVKFLLTHKKIQIQLDKLLYTIGIRSEKEKELIPGYTYISEQRYKHIKSEIRNAKDMLNEKFGIIITNSDMVQCTQNDKVWYSKVKVPYEITHPKKLSNDKDQKFSDTRPSPNVKKPDTPTENG